MQNDEEIIAASNPLSIKRLEDPYKYNMYDGVRVQIYGASKCTITNKLDFLHDI